MRFIGRTTGMSVNHFLSVQFKLNELKQKKLTDEELIKKVQDEFRYYRLVYTISRLQTARSNYNTGYLIPGFIPPNKSFRYDSNGCILTSRGNKMSIKQIKASILKHKERLNLAN